MDHKPPARDDQERPLQDQQQPRPNRRRSPYLLPDLNLLYPPPLPTPTIRPAADALFSREFPISDEEMTEDSGDDADPVDEIDEEVVYQLAQIYINRELAYLNNWMEELRREMLQVRDELQSLLKLFGLYP